MQPDFSCVVDQLSFVSDVLPNISGLVTPTIIQYVLAALFGLVFGSFLNVCIARLPNHESIVRPRSRCPQCLKPIPWYDNVPLISYLFLGARCRFCRRRISPLYPIVEALTACVFVLAVAETSTVTGLVKEVVFVMLMIVLIFTDFTERIIPHSVTLLGIALGLGFSSFVPVNDVFFGWIFGGSEYRLQNTLSSLLGALSGGAFGGGLLYIVAWALKRVSNPAKEYLGFGDVMLMLVVGVFWGIPLSYLTILFGSLAGTVVAVSFIALKKSSREYQWPYGSFLGAAAIYCSLQGPDLLAAYKHWAGLR
jgi:leader peptidase (prepilin peptidase) / N-methyltransferase